MKRSFKGWAVHGYNFDLDWLLRSVNTVLTGEAKFSFLHGKCNRCEGWFRTGRQAHRHCLNLIGGRLGLDHDQVLFGRYAIPVMVRYLDQRSGLLDARERDELLLVRQAGMWGRLLWLFRTYIDQDLAAFEGNDVL